MNVEVNQYLSYIQAAVIEGYIMSEDKRIKANLTLSHKGFEDQRPKPLCSEYFCFLSKLPSGFVGSLF